MKKIKILTFVHIFLYLITLILSCPLLNLNLSTDLINFSCIMICLLIALFSVKYSLFCMDSLLLFLALFFTAAADFCLIIMNFPYIGLVFFSVVQTLYSIRYSGGYKIILIEIVALICIFNIFKLQPLLLAFSVFYGFCIISSCINAIISLVKRKYPAPNKYMIVSGMLLFLLCDINVALRNFSMVSNSFSASALSYYFIFLFYLPSQLLLCLSGINFRYSHQ